MATMQITFEFNFSPEYMLQNLVKNCYTINLREDVDEYLRGLFDEFGDKLDKKIDDGLKKLKLLTIDEVNKIDSDGDESFYEITATIMCSMSMRQKISEVVACTEMYSPAILDC